jgi:hypothetical protein
MSNIDNVQTKSRLKTAHETINRKHLKQQWFSHLLAVATLLTAANVCGFDAKQDSTFGKSDGIVTVAVNGDLKLNSIGGMYTEITSETYTLTDNTFSSDATLGKVRTVTMSSSKISIADLQSKWHFIMVLVGNRLRSDRSLQVNWLLLPTEEIVANEYYEMGKNYKRRIVFKWLNNSGPIEFRQSSPEAIDSDVRIERVSVSGFLKK